MNNAEFAASHQLARSMGPAEKDNEETQGRATSEDITVSDDIDAAKLLSWFADAHQAQEDWHRKAVEWLKMVSGDQWPAEVLANLPPNMAPIVINIMLAPILFLSGIQRQTREEPKIVAAAGANPQAAEVMNMLVHWVETQGMVAETNSQVFLQKLVIGLGWWKTSMDYDCEDIEGTPSIERRSALGVFPDPNFFEEGWKEAQFVFDSEWMSIGDASQKWPDFRDEFKTAGGDWVPTSGRNGMGAFGEEAGDIYADQRLFWDADTKRVRVLEAWYKVTEEREVAVNVMETEEVYSDEDEVDTIREAIKANPELESEWIVFTKPVTTVRVAHLFRDKLLDKHMTPFNSGQNLSRFPLQPAMGFYFWKSPFGMGALMQDLQMEKNKRRSKLIELVGRMPLAGFFNKRVGGADSEQLKNYGAGVGVEVTYDTEKPEAIRPPDLPAALLNLEQKATEEIKLVTNVNDELLGQTTQKTVSGQAIHARQQGGFISHEYLFDTFRLENIHRVRYLIEVIKQYISPTKALRILGDMASQGQEQAMAMMQGVGEDPGLSLALEEVLSNAFDQEYDVVISSRPTDPSLTMQSWEVLSGLKEKGAEIPPKVLWEAAEKAGLLTQAQVKEILEFIQASMQPPGGMPPTGQVPPGMPLPPPAPPAPVA